MSNISDFFNDFIPNYNKPSSITISNLIPVTKSGHQITIGKGTCSEVYLAKDFKTENNIYAIKHMNKSHIIKEIYTLQIIYNEIEIHSRLNHKNIITLYNKYENDTDIYLIMEYANKGNLYNLLQRKKYFKEQEAYFYFKQVVEAISYLHSYNIIHRDIKPENLLLSDNNDENNKNNLILKLCDFGWCTLLSNNNDHRNTICGTVEYMAPEILNNEEYNKGIDIWALGILLYELCHGYSPFNNETNNKKNKINIIEKKIKESTFKIKDELSFECKDLIKKCLIKDLNKRITIEDIIKHPFLKKWENQEKNNNTKVNVNNNKDYFKILNDNKNIIKNSLPIKNRNKNNLFLDDNTKKPNHSNTLTTTILKEHKNYYTNNIEKVKKCVKLILTDSENDDISDEDKNNINDTSTTFDDEKPKKIYNTNYKLNELKNLNNTSFKKEYPKSSKGKEYPKSSKEILNLEDKFTNLNESILTNSSNILIYKNNNQINRRNSEIKIIRLKMNKIDKKYNISNNSPFINKRLSTTFTNKNLDFNSINNIEKDFPLNELDY